MFVAGGVGEVVPCGALTALFRPKGGIGEDHVIALHSLAQVGQGIAQSDGSLHIVEHGVHQGQAVGVVYQLAAGKRLCPFKGGGIGVQVKEIVGLRRDILMGRNHKAEGAAGRVVAPLPRLGLHQAGHDVDQHAGREILPRPGFFLVGVFL